jgi:hypothetical protein
MVCLIINMVRMRRGDVIGVYGPAISTDGGANWTWLGRDSMTDTAFRYSFAANANEVRFCVTIPYLEADLQDFLKRHAGDRHLQVSSLCETQQGREVELLHLGRFDGHCDHRVLLTCRHHACESMASCAPTPRGEHSDDNHRSTGEQGEAYAPLLCHVVLSVSVAASSRASS